MAPLTSFDWASFDVGKIITSSIDCSCCLWDIEVRPRVTRNQIALPKALQLRPRYVTCTWHMTCDTI